MFDQQAKINLRVPDIKICITVQFNLLRRLTNYTDFKKYILENSCYIRRQI